MKLTFKDHVCDVLVWAHDKLHLNEDVICWIAENFIWNSNYYRQVLMLKS